MAIHNYDNITYHITGISVINDPEQTKQEGLLIHFRLRNPDYATFEPMTIFIDKYDAAHIAKITHEGRSFWKRFRLPKMQKQ